MITSHKTPSQPLSLPIITDPALLQKIIFEDFHQSVSANGEMVMPCIPALGEYYIKRVWAMFNAIDDRLTQEQLIQIGQMVAKNLEEGFRMSPHTKLRLKYEPSQPANEGYSFKTSILVSSITEEYQKWVENKQPFLFGSHPDAKVMAVAAEFGEPATVSVLDVGAGIGRNTLALAKRGYQVDALELSPVLVERLQAALPAEQVTVTLGDILDPLVRMPLAHYRLGIGVEFVASHCRDAEQLRLFLLKMCDFLCSEGLLLFSIFLCNEDYKPDPLTRQISQVKWSCIFTRQDLANAMEGLPIELISDESVLRYEREHRPEETWTPTAQFSDWAMGHDVFEPSADKPAMELRWILCRRS